MPGGGSNGGGAAGGCGGLGERMPMPQLAGTPAALQSVCVLTVTDVAPMTGGAAPPGSRTVTTKVESSRHAPE